MIMRAADTTAMVPATSSPLQLSLQTVLSLGTKDSGCKNSETFSIVAQNLLTVINTRVQSLPANELSRKAR